MKRSAVACLFIIAIVIGTAIANYNNYGSIKPQVNTANFGLEVTLSPSNEYSNAYDCNITIHDLKNSELLSSTIITAKNGEEVSISSGLEGRKEKLQAIVIVADKASNAKYKINISDGEEIVVSYSGIIQLTE
ncbi:MAG: hypothetical protein AB1489_29055 [Acidobacteriota bacterium]